MLRRILLLLGVCAILCAGAKCNNNFAKVVLIGDSNLSGICSDPTPPCVPGAVVMQETMGSPWKVLNHAIPGAGLATGPGWFEWDGQCQLVDAAITAVGDFPAAMVFIQLGGNDAPQSITPSQWQARLVELVNCLLEPGRAVVVVLNTAPPLNSQAPLAWQLKHAQFQTKVVNVCTNHSEAGYRVYCGVDAFNLTAPYIPPNNAHLNTEGHRVLGEAMAARHHELFGIN